ncbi:xylose isomerase [Alsobacter metallidurans]|uniref:Xylose isomerase n=1 Tax=Alsobacter metallidurans TaxID=340221 RepID=A0A917I7I5_9HYPH|nr:sugar phosphate isomerase/epimerase [Alsobacter metallidurans]GGH18381.1 xylose isomerase [Alsobacter metallidurans]
MTPLDGLSFQLYSARMMEPLEAQFELLAGLGYRKVEPFGGLLGDPDRLKRQLDEHGMAAPSCHVGMDRLRADPVATVKLCRGLGIETIYAPAPPPGERDGGEAEWTAMGRELNGICKTVNGEGLRFGWHNHHFEYGQTADGRRFLHILLEEAPQMLWEADLAWIVRGGADPIAEVKRYAGRVEVVHVKDIAPEGHCADEDGWADPGHGVLDWSAIVPVLQEIGVKLFVAEHDKPNDVARFARRAMTTVASWR